jgi:hypothetical protein
MALFWCWTEEKVGEGMEFNYRQVFVRKIQAAERSFSLERSYKNFRTGSSSLSFSDPSVMVMWFRQRDWPTIAIGLAQGMEA